jgi:SAM-dependent methyltransferase
MPEQAPELAASFGRAAEAYELGRPGWPPAVLDVLELPDDAVVLDLAAGTGKLTRVLVERYGRVVAVEPLEEMRAVLEQAVPAAEARAGRADAIPAADGEFEAVFVAQAFHWFATDEVVAELARVMRPGAPLALLWNTLESSRFEPPLPDAYLARVRSLKEGVDFPFSDDRWRAALERGPFGELHEANVAHHRQVDGETLVAQVASYSWVARRPTAERGAILRELRKLLPEATYRQSLVAEIVWTVRQ